MIIALLVTLSAAPAPSVAFYYGQDPPVGALDLNDWVVVEPEHLGPEEVSGFHHARLYAYVGGGEVHPSRPYAPRIDPGWRLGQNPAWKSAILDLGRPEWRNFLLKEVITPLLQSGYHGIFLDALDSHQLLKLSPEQRQAQSRGLLSLVREIRALHPKAQILLNRGFEVVSEAAPLLSGIVFESYFQGWEPKSGRFQAVSEADRSWLRQQLEPAREAGLPVIAIDYLPPDRFGEAPALAKQLHAAGWVPYVTDPQLSRLGVGALEPLPREVLLLWDGKRHRDVAFSEVHRLVAMPLEYQGLVPVYVDVHAGLPKGALAGRYAGVVAWIGAYPVADPEALRGFFRRAIKEQVKVVFLGDFPGELDDAFLKELGLERGPRSPYAKVQVDLQGDLLGFEAPVRPRGRVFYPLRANGSGFEAQLALRSDGAIMAAVGFAPWGGWALEPHLLEEGVDGDLRWILDPFRFLERALALPAAPVLDPTTENGRRLAFFHIDGDGMASKAEMPGAPYAGEVIRRWLAEHRWPHAVSIVEGETSPTGMYPESSAALEALSRQIFALPHVEVASHGYLHPFRWAEFEARAGTPGLHLALPGAVPSIPREITGSIEYINRLAPPDKPTRLFLWTGDALPSEATLAEARRAGVRNLNGGVTEVTQDRPSMTRVWPMTRPVGQELQVYAPVINENVYTNLWTGPYYGFRRVLETFALTESPRRLKPIDVYYHFYSGSKVAGQQALAEVYDFVERGEHLPIFPSAWADRAADFRRATLARGWDGSFLAMGLGQNRSFRVPTSFGAPQLGDGVIGFRDTPVGRFLHTDGRDRVVLRFGPQPPSQAYLHDASAALLSWSTAAEGPHLRWAPAGPLHLALAGPGASRCRLEGVGRRRAPTMEGKVARFLLQESESGRARLICR